MKNSLHKEIATEARRTADGLRHARAAHGATPEHDAVEALHRLQVPQHHTHIERQGQDHHTHPHGTPRGHLATIY